MCEWMSQYIAFGEASLEGISGCVFNPSSQLKGKHPWQCTGDMNGKKQQYEQSVQEVEHTIFTTLVLSSTGGLGKAPQCSTRDWFQCSARREVSSRVRQWDGSDVV